MKFNSHHHHRRSIRLLGYDYSQPGAYYVTICTHQREYWLGTVQDRKMFLSRSGEMVEHCWRMLSDHFQYIELDKFIVMPNHLHGIVTIKDYGQANSVLSLNGTKSRSLGSIIQNFKSISTRKVRQASRAEGAIIWQRGYYERVIRDAAELNNIRGYIEANPARWKNNV
jgi:REP element-mobilizing transposase RayT